MFEEFDHVKITDWDIPGIIVSKNITDGVAWYVVESDLPGPMEGGYGGLWPLFDCMDEDLEPLEHIEFISGAMAS